MTTTETHTARLELLRDIREILFYGNGERWVLIDPTDGATFDAIEIQCAAPCLSKAGSDFPHLALPAQVLSTRAALSRWDEGRFVLTKTAPTSTKKRSNYTVLADMSQAVRLTSLSDEKTDQAEPGLVRKAANFTAAAAAHAADGFRNVSKADQAARMEICRGNACGQFNAESETCRKCGCDLQVKTRWRSGDCPLGLWPAPASSAELATRSP